MNDDATQYPLAPSHWPKPASCTCTPGVYREPASGNRAERRRRKAGHRYSLVHEHGCGVEEALQQAVQSRSDHPPDDGLVPVVL